MAFFLLPSCSLCSDVWLPEQKTTKTSKLFCFVIIKDFFKANVKFLIDKLLYYFLHIMFVGILEEKSKAMASALFNTFHSINTSASVLPVLKATAHKYQQRTRSQAGQITRRWRGEAKHQGGEDTHRTPEHKSRLEESLARHRQTSLSSPTMLGLAIPALTNHKNKDNYCSKDALCCSPPSYILSSDQTRQSQILF